jgi:hypothetical protein
MLGLSLDIESISAKGFGDGYPAGVLRGDSFIPTHRT